MIIAVQSTTKRWEASDQMKLFLRSTDGTIIKNVKIEGSAAAGIFVDDSQNFLLQDVVVEDTRADGIHNTNGSHDGSIVRPIIRNSGDDGVAVVSYKYNALITRDIVIDSPKLYSNTWGRGFSVVGGMNITYNDVYVENSSAAGIYVAAESSYDTYGIKNVVFNGGTLVGVNTNATVDHGAIFVYNSQPPEAVEDVTINDIIVTDTNPVVSRQVALLTIGSPLGSNRVEFRNITMTGGPASPFTVNGTNTYNRKNWTKDGTPLADYIDY